MAYDIVCYWSKEATFNGVEGDTLKGPFLLVDSLDALADPHLHDRGESETKAAFRPWLGVPAGVFVGNDLYLYYTAAPNYDIVLKSARPYLDNAPGWLGVVADFNDGEGFEQATVVRVVSAFTFRANIAWGSGDTDEKNWTTASAIAGTPNLPVRAWMTLPRQPHCVESFSEQVIRAGERAGSVYPPGAAGLRVKIVDPMPYVCEDLLGMFVSVQPKTFVHVPDAGLSFVDPSGPSSSEPERDWLYGLWRLRAVDPDTIRRLNEGGVPFAPEFGRDFVVEGRLGLGDYPDQVVAAYATDTDHDASANGPDEGGEHYYVPLDPDAVYIPDLGLWRIYTHIDGELVYFAASDEQVCEPAFDAWDTSSRGLTPDVVSDPYIRARMLGDAIRAREELIEDWVDGTGDRGGDPR